MIISALLMPNADDCRTDATMIIKISERGTMSTPALLEFNKASAFQEAKIKAYSAARRRDAEKRKEMED